MKFLEGFMLGLMICVILLGYGLVKKQKKDIEELKFELKECKQK